ncbi:hypothetical protein PV371_17095 [Streptomyces sp. TX20-6-3]|uniref:hypothetical protein n=1 Tax=Streptomyces sp. TX20-6-3 TaxID=3028705 RepID=UPI0029BF8BF7|nr:hypothetical protein [Streptomyces sp. TX20-6-3]MDX2561363.1 hypothetical protein [Streptomyces sp. TX20-6-3]
MPPSAPSAPPTVQTRPAASVAAPKRNVSALRALFTLNADEDSELRTIDQLTDLVVQDPFTALESPLLPPGRDLRVVW